MKKDQVLSIAKDLQDSIENWFGAEEIPVSAIQPLDLLRKKAWKKFKALSWPTNKDEEWKKVDLKNFPFNKMKAIRLLNGDIKADLLFASSEENRVRNIFLGCSEDAVFKHTEEFTLAYEQLVDDDRNKFGYLAAVFGTSGSFIYVPPNIKTEETVEITLSHKEESLGLFNHMIWLESGASAEVVIDINGDTSNRDAQLSVSNFSIHLGEGAKLTLIETHNESDRSWDIYQSVAKLDAKSELNWTIVKTGSHFSKQFLQVDLEGQDSKAKIACIYLAGGKQEMEFNTRQNHLSQGTGSDLMYKGVLMGDSRTLFSGMIQVKPNAIKSDGYQANRNLILSSNAHADSQPGLEILANDVRCTHGATVGQIDMDELFYLKSRGLDDRGARRLITQGFLNPVIDQVALEPVRKKMLKLVDSNLEEI
ncbi:MAG: Fe-S cluster assembly protein SufD [Anaerolineaceae bacterium]|nr:Fe-S cluster assembly protein SufD [Anaerolineaceae bacterium]